MDVAEAIRKEALRRGYSPRTVQTYQRAVGKFFLWCGKEPAKVSKADLREFLYGLKDKEKAGNTINVYLNALKFFFEDVLRRKMNLNITYSKVPERLPVVFTKEEVKRLIHAIDNPKHRLMIMLLYSAGLRVSELLSLHVKDIHFDHNYGYVRQGKGAKDRLFILSEKMKEPLLASVRDESLSEGSFLFTSNRNKKYHARSVQQILREASRKAGIRQNVNPHTLRHSFATHLIADGYSVSEVQALLGHKSPETTMIYVHLASPTLIKVKSPFDSL